MLCLLKAFVPTRRDFTLIDRLIHNKCFKFIKRTSTRKAVKMFVALSMVLTTLASSFLSVNALSETYTVIKGKDVYEVNTVSLTPEKIVERAGVAIGENDEIVLDEESNTITVKPEFQFDVIDQNGKRTTIKTTDMTVDEALSIAGVTLGENDTVSPALGTKLCDYTTAVVVMRWVNVKIILDGNYQTSILIPAGTKANSAVKACNINIDNDDVCSVPLEQALNEDTVIDIKQATLGEQTVIESIDFETEYVETDALMKGKKQVQTQGENGERIVVKQVSVSTTDGSVLKEVEINSVITKQAVNKVVLVGTAQPSVPNVKGAPTSYKKAETAVCTAYCDKGVTATGVSSGVGKVAVNPNDIPYGTRMYICSADGSYVYGYCIAADTGGAMRGGGARIDLFFNTRSECISFGRRTMNVYFV